jgi:hypothetical protein
MNEKIHKFIDCIREKNFNEAKSLMEEILELKVQEQKIKNNPDIGD